MLLAILVIIIIGVVVYFHYLQGLFSAGLSAVLAVVAALLAMGWHETVVALVSGGRFADIAHGAVLVSLFALIYLLLRVIFDKVVPGNVRFHLLVDKIGAACFGLVAGLMVCGVLVVAAQTMPFAPSIAGYSRFPIAYDKRAEIVIPGSSQRMDALYDELDDAAFRENRAGRLLLPVDDLLQVLTRMASDSSGSLSNGRPFADVHPDYLQELFGQRAGLQSGSRRCALPGRSHALAIYTAPSLPQQDQERMSVGGFPVGIRSKAILGENYPLRPVYKPEAGRMLLVVRIFCHRDDADHGTDMFAFAPAGIRLCVNRRNYFPIGTLQDAQTLFVNAVDDPLFVSRDSCVDVVFDVEEDDLMTPPDETGRRRIRRGAFVEIKRLVQTALWDMPLEPLAAAARRTDRMGIVRKHGVLPEPKDKDKEG